ncbi:MAG TPA: glycosyltransferase 87 family protein, partial [Pseudonocardiaceae bacterium]|nr:glycosyltransferase 87 family protein [Pseudonocardiaceae bacterium]
ARVAFGLVSALIVFIALRILGRPKVPTRAAQLILACPLTTLTFAVAGDDLVIVALILLALALLHRRRPVWCGGVIAVAVSIKLTASPALIVLAVAVFGLLGLRSLVRFCAAVIGVGIVVTVPVMLIDPRNFVEQVVKFPLGIGMAHSPAQSPLPGVLIAQLGPAGHDVALALMCAAALGIGGWLVIRPPRWASDAAFRSAIGLGLAIMLSPATRYGYLVYPLALFGAAITLRAMENRDEQTKPESSDPAASAPEKGLEVGETAQLGLAFRRPLLVEGRPVGRVEQ